jgi:nitrate/nitrite transport system substrate-binding protein
VEQVLTGQFPDGKGNDIDAPDRIDFDPFPWNSMAVWILTQMKRWGYVKGDLDYKKVAEQVFLAADCRDIMTKGGYQAPSANYKEHVIMGKTFDPSKPEEYINSFDIKRV